jgi:hypothetical protein
MAKVFVHYRDRDSGGEWVNLSLEFVRLPIVGEYVAISETSEWLRVYAVVHCPFPASFDAEIYMALDSTHLEAIEAREPLPWGI